MRENRDRPSEVISTATRAPRHRWGLASRGITALAGSLLLAAMTTACGGTDSGDTQAVAPASIKAADADVPGDERRPVHPKLVTRGANDAFPALYAHLSGTLVITDDHCVAVTAAKTGKPTTIVWGHGWSVREDNGKATVYDAAGEPFAREGDRVGLGGGTSERFAGKPCVTGTVFEANDTQTAP